MPRRRRLSARGLIFHVLNRGAKRTAIFDGPAEFEEFEGLLQQSATRFNVAVYAYCLMPNHWHLVIAPTSDAALSKCMHWLTTTHARRWQLRHDAEGLGAVYQGRFRAIPVQDDRHFLWVCRYVERNAVRAGLVETARAWRWCSLSLRATGDAGWLAPWPVDRGPDWTRLVDTPQTAAELAAFRAAVTRDQGFGTELWKQSLTRETTRRGRGRPKATGSVLEK